MSRENLEKEGITLLGNQKVKYPDDYAPEVLETFLNKHPDNDYFVKFNCPEFTSLCPITGQPDFATITISYVPGEKMVESKSLKLYLFSFRNHGDFHEDCVNIIMKDLIRLMDPKYIEVWGKFTPRGGISIDPYCNYGKAGTRWEEIAWKRLTEHDMDPEKIDNREKNKKSLFSLRKAMKAGAFCLVRLTAQVYLYDSRMHSDSVPNRSAITSCTVSILSAI